MSKIHWSELTLRDADGTEAHNIQVSATDDAHFRGLLEFRRAGSISGLYFDRIGAPHEREDDASTWGPRTPDDVDWTGFNH